jgi:uncharacterized protein YjiS (DUF1127 family)
MTITQGHVARAFVRRADAAYRRSAPAVQPVSGLPWTDGETTEPASFWWDHNSAFGYIDIATHQARARILRSRMRRAVMKKSAIALLHLLRSSAMTVATALRTAYAGIVCARRRRASIRALQALDDRTLKDIGLHRSQITSAVYEVPADASRSTGDPRPMASTRLTRSLFRPVGAVRPAGSA